MSTMATGNWTVYVPDRTAPVSLPSSLTTEEVRATLVGTGYTSVESAEMTISGSTITFRRPQGGTKGL
jgi:ethanolamine utilization protein EutA (predicted chaperonin)